MVQDSSYPLRGTIGAAVPQLVSFTKTFYVLLITFYLLPVALGYSTSSTKRTLMPKCLAAIVISIKASPSAVRAYPYESVYGVVVQQQTLVGENPLYSKPARIPASGKKTHPSGSSFFQSSAENAHTFISTPSGATKVGGKISIPSLPSISETPYFLQPNSRR